MGKRGARSAEATSLFDRELAGCGFADKRLAKRYKALVRQLADGNGSFAAAATFAVGMRPQSVAVGDFNAEGTPDLAVANLFSANVSVLMGAGNGSFAAARNFAIAFSSTSVTVGDFDADGTLDLAVDELGITYRGLMKSSNDGARTRGPISGRIHRARRFVAVRFDGIARSRRSPYYAGHGLFVPPGKIRQANRASKLPRAVFTVFQTVAIVSSMRFRPGCWACAVVLVVLTLPAAGSTTAETARKILDRSMEADVWDDRYRRMTLELREHDKVKRTRELEVFERRPARKELSSILFFLEPEDVRGIGLLALNHDQKPADQWIYLPAYRRVRPITRSTRNERFVGTDLTYQDLDIFSGLLQWNEDDATSTLLGDENIEGIACHKIQLVPHRSDIDYARILVWIAIDSLMPRQIELFPGEAKGSGVLGLFGSGVKPQDHPSKRIQLRRVRSVDGVNVAFEILIETLSENTSTAITVTDVKFNQNLPSDLFNHRALERGPR